MVNGASDVGVAQLSLRIEDPKGEYVNLIETDVENVDEFNNNCNGVGDSGLVLRSSRCWLVWWWARLIILLIFVGLLAAVFFKWVGPFVMNKVCTQYTLLHLYVCVYKYMSDQVACFLLFDEMHASVLFLWCLPMKIAHDAFSDHLLVIFLNASLLSSPKCHCT